MLGTLGPSHHLQFIGDGYRVKRTDPSRRQSFVDTGSFL